MVLVPIVLAALYLATEPFTVGVITATTITIWIITAVASPTRKGGIPVANKVSDYPVIECPNCGTPNSITTEQRPFRLPCQGCGRVLKIVE
jgi:ribosomal protein S27E